MCASDETAWKESPLLSETVLSLSRAHWELGTIQILTYSCGCRWQSSLLAPRGTCLIRSWSADLDKAEEQFEIIPKYKTVSSEMSLWPALFFAEGISKENGLKLLKELRLEELLQREGLINIRMVYQRRSMESDSLKGLRINACMKGWKCLTWRDPGRGLCLRLLCLHLGGSCIFFSVSSVQALQVLQEIIVLPEGENK